MDLDSALHLVCLVAAGNPEQPTSTVLIDKLKLIKKDEVLWAQLFFAMRLGRITQLFYWQLSRQNLESLIPRTLLDRFQKRYIRSKTKNTSLIKKFSSLSAQLEAHNFHYSAWKGLPLLAACYPDVGSRPMADVDLSMCQARQVEAVELFQSLGLHQNENLKLNPETYGGIDENGLEFDIHFNAEFFKDYPFEELHHKMEFPSMNQSFFAPKPEVMLAHLMWHWEKHTRTWGHILRHFFDLLFFYRRYGKSLDTKLVSKYLKDPKARTILFRANAFILELAPQTPIPNFDSMGSPLPAYTIEELRRSILLASSHLNRRKSAWGRLVLSWFGIVKARKEFSPNAKDIVLAYFDLKRHQRELKALRKTSP